MFQSERTGASKSNIVIPARNFGQVLQHITYSTGSDLDPHNPENAPDILESVFGDMETHSAGVYVYSVPEDCFDLLTQTVLPALHGLLESSDQEEPHVSFELEDGTWERWGTSEN